MRSCTRNVSPILTVTLRLLPAVCVLAANAYAVDAGSSSSLQIIGGAVAGQLVSPANRTVIVAPGSTITGSLTLQVNSTYPSGAPMMMGITPSWGDHATSFTDLGTFPTPISGFVKNATISYTAPSTPGIYYIIAAYRSELSTAQVMSATNFALGAPSWGDEDDIAAWSATTVNTANTAGTVSVPYKTAFGELNLYVPAAAIIVSVQDLTDQGQNSSLQITSGVLNGVILGSQHNIVVNPGTHITGSVSYLINSAYPASSTMAMATTPTWGNHATAFTDNGSFTTPAQNLSKTVNVDVFAPDVPGTYFLITAFRPEATAAQLMSSTATAVGSPQWNNGDDVADWPAAAVIAAMQHGTTLVNYLTQLGESQYYVPSNAIEIDVAGADPGLTSNMLLTGGTVAGQAVSTANRTITVNPGSAVAGSFTVAINSTWPADAPMALAVTPTWGSPQTSFVDLGAIQTPASGLAKNIPVNFLAPTQPGVYYIIAAFRSERSAAQLMSETASAAGPPVWNDSEDIASWSTATINAANLAGNVSVPYQTALMNSLVSVPATAIRVVVTGATSANPLQFVPITPCRAVDTRNANGPLGGPTIGGGGSRSFNLTAGPCAIPATAQAYSLNVTVVPQGSLPYLTLWPTGQTQPLVSTLNSPDARIKANMALVPAGTGGAISVNAAGKTDVVIDVNGYFVPASGNDTLAFYPVTPCRISDTRNSNGAYGGPSFAATETRTIAVPGSNCHVPATARAYSLNFTAVPNGPLAYVSTWPTGFPQPGVSTLNALSGAITANAAIVPAGANGAINVYATNKTDLVIDVNGYFAPAGSGYSFYAVSPCRIVDTRNANGAFGGPIIAAGQSRSYIVPNSACPSLAGGRAYSLNATVVPPGALGYLTLWPTDVTQPFVSTLNALDGSITSNAAIVPASSVGSISAYVTSTTDVVLDVNGFFAP